ncbi:helix-turn-helix transcriptional regulator [Terracoccus luteus]|uniref:DNA-binding CsgD family transcriptional regulator/DNA-binding MarR family transcriptional regulator n=1 Tax=Terracoccus luteus TaxID=53356 RepID=A0A839PWB3_9MICO|nr:LuxR family transcriptional regulator [Terracoccus luteus]MBB2987363.1 DNA-binding CsgD family transcriptional regulator/DNA-binding MarR family transcriptional regulator [Terracoccus luteus]MCP2173014.1 DNA-binding CsgD family transcriptional regulator/DNA-binding MarR family transcriptional regulator [Terracoccus luteus]
MPLDPREERAYRLVVGLAGARSDQLAEVAGTTTSDAADLLARLHAKGLVSRRPGGEPEFVALPPEVALATTLLRQQESLDAARQLVSSLSDEYRAASRRRDAHAAVEVVVGSRVLRDTLRGLQDSATSEILWFCRANPLAMAGSENLEEEAALRRGVRYRAVYERALVESPGELGGILEAVGWGEEARVTPTLPVRLAVVDRSTAVCPLTYDGDRAVGEPSAAVIGRGQLLDALLALFEGCWERATPLVGGVDGAAAPTAGVTEPVTEAGDAVTAQDRTVLSLVVAGLPDKSISSQLRVSRRTVQRRLTRLMTIAGVDTRTALAYQAARRGWV